MKNTENHLLGSLTFYRLGWVEFYIYRFCQNLLFGQKKSGFLTKCESIVLLTWISHNRNAELMKIEIAKIFDTWK